MAESVYKRSEKLLKVQKEYEEKKKKTSKKISMQGKNIVSSISDSLRNKLLSQTKLELEQSEEGVSEHVATFGDRKRGYLDQTQTADVTEVDYNILYSTVDAYLALTYSNKMRARFIGGPSDTIEADLMTKNAEYDWDHVMDMDFIMYATGIDKMLLGPGITIFDSRNSELNGPYVRYGDVEDWRPDPKGWGRIKEFKFMGFYGEITEQEMEELNFENIKENVDVTMTHKNKEDDYDMIGSVVDSVDQENPRRAIYDHFLIRKYKGEYRYFLVTTNESQTVIHRVVELPYGRIPVCLDYFRPKKGNPYGITLYDLGYKKQRNINIILNLGIKKAIRSSLGNHMAIDTARVRNKSILTNLTEVPKILSIDTKGGTRPVTDFASEIQRSQVPADNYDSESRLKNILGEETGITQQTLGVSQTGQQTKYETEELERNANLRISLVNKISFWFLTDFFEMYLEFYKFRFSKGNKEKLFVISNDNVDTYYTLKPKHINFKFSPKIKIGSKSEEETQNKMLLAGFQQIWALIDEFAQRQDSKLEGRYALRKMLRLLGISEDDIKRLVRQTYEEMDALENLALLNNYDEFKDFKGIAKPTKKEIFDEHEVYIKTYANARPSKFKDNAINDRKVALKKRREMEREQERKAKAQAMMPEDTGAGGGQMNAVKNQMVANGISQQNNAVANPQAPTQAQ